MNLLFEKCLERLFRENLTGMEFTPQKDYRLFSFDSSCNPRNQPPFGFKPDYTFESGDKTIILDAKYRDLWEEKLPPSMLYQLAVYALAAVPHRSVILYPTLSEKAEPQRINLARLCTVTLQPVDLNRFSGLVSEKSDPESRKRYAETLVMTHCTETA